jgi:hypothetical protein
MYVKKNAFSDGIGDMYIPFFPVREWILSLRLEQKI